MPHVLTRAPRRTWRRTRHKTATKPTHPGGAEGGTRTRGRASNEALDRFGPGPTWSSPSTTGLYGTTTSASTYLTNAARYLQVSADRRCGS